MMTTKGTLLKTIRLHCLNCCGGSWKDVHECAAGPEAEKAGFPVCALWQFRLGSDPTPSRSRQVAGLRAHREKMKENREKIEA